MIPLPVDPADVFAVFGHQDSGCVSVGVRRDGLRWFVTTSTTAASGESLRRAYRFHAAVQHPAIVAPVDMRDEASQTTLVYPWVDGEVLNAATTRGSDRSGLERFRALPVDEVLAAIDAILDAHVAAEEAGFVAVDLYDGCFLYDFDARVLRLIDLDEYRPGPFSVTADRLPGSHRYMAPEQLTRGGVNDSLTEAWRAVTTGERAQPGDRGA